VFQGLANLLAPSARAWAAMFQISQHAPAMGTVLTSAGRRAGRLFAALGHGHVGRRGTGLPRPAAAGQRPAASWPTSSSVIEPILPGIALGFLAWKAAAIIAPLLGTLAGQLDTVGIKALMAADNLIWRPPADSPPPASGAWPPAPVGLEAAMGPIGWIIAGISLPPSR
jgi:hypothetical protein